MAVSTLKRCCALGLALAAAARAVQLRRALPGARPPHCGKQRAPVHRPRRGGHHRHLHHLAGEVRAVLYPDAAPMAVYNFAGLARSGYYDDTVIWRSQYGFAVQGGDAEGTGTGGATIYNNSPHPAGGGREPAPLCRGAVPGHRGRGCKQPAAASFTLSPRCPTAWTRRCSPS